MSSANSQFRLNTKPELAVAKAVEKTIGYKDPGVDLGSLIKKFSGPLARGQGKAGPGEPPIQMPWRKVRPKSLISSSPGSALIFLIEF